MSMNVVTLLYLVASVFFIQALKGLSHPTTSLRGNLFGMTGMTIAVLTTGALIVETAGGQAGGIEGAAVILHQPSHLDAIGMLGHGVEAEGALIQPRAP
jgi:NAD/NADP transhydrogenase beta subunit